MQSLAGVLSALDPSVQDSVKIISYFDALVSMRVGVDGVLRAATLLGGCPAGMISTATGLGRRVDTAGSATPASTDVADGWPTFGAPEGALAVWIERRGAAHINDEMLLERLSLAMAITVERTTRYSQRPALEALIDTAAPRDEREAAAGSLGLSVTSVARVAALPAATTRDGDFAQSVVFPTEVGLLRAVVWRGDPLPRRVGIGLPTSVMDLSTSWRSAVVALKLTTPARPRMDAAELGVLLQLDALDPNDPDVTALARIEHSSPWAIETLEALAYGGSVRGAATLLQRHHSTIHARVDALSSALGFDVQSPAGRARVSIAVALLRMQIAQF
jgi:hypothetical protein